MTKLIQYAAFSLAIVCAVVGASFVSQCSPIPDPAPHSYDAAVTDDVDAGSCECIDDAGVEVDAS
jgi:hypothetical protein